MIFKLLKDIDQKFNLHCTLECYVCLLNINEEKKSKIYSRLTE